MPAAKIGGHKPYALAELEAAAGPRCETPDPTITELWQKITRSIRVASGRCPFLPHLQ
jgi:hypothetical protein